MKLPIDVMRVLLLQPEDFPDRGPWSRQRWDLIIDLGRSSAFSEEKWGRLCGCPVLRSDSFRHGIADVRQVREIFSAGRGQLIDEEGIDWWDLTSLLVAPHALTLSSVLAVANEISQSAELWATRPGGAALMLGAVLKRPVQNFGESDLARSAARAMHYAGLVRRFSAAQFKEIFLDKYDAGYRWRSRFVAPRQACVRPVVLLPSAYGNASRMAAAYASLLPEQLFLMVATRESAKKFVPPPNVQVQDLAAYARTDSPLAQVTSLTERWRKLRSALQSSPELRLLSQVGFLDSFPAWIRDGLSARNAWREVLEREPVSAVLCGDDSNLYTRLPVLLAARRKIPTVDFHHGALDGRYLLKELPCDRYLAKSEMERDYLLRVCGLTAERVVSGAPPSVGIHSLSDRDCQRRSSSVVLFSEPYEVAGRRAEEVYRELLPSLCRIARQNARGVIIKLHPFESLSQRRRTIRAILTPQDRALVVVVEGPLSAELMAQAWFGITVESTTAIDCLQNGVCCFLCNWLSLSPYGYGQQYARFQVGEVLQNALQLSEIPSRLADFQKRPAMNVDLSAAVDPARLRGWLTKSDDPVAVRSVS
jgi:hypothetical protein